MIYKTNQNKHKNLHIKPVSYIVNDDGSDHDGSDEKWGGEWCHQWNEKWSYKLRYKLRYTWGSAWDDKNHHTFLSPSKALTLGLLPFVSIGLFHDDLFENPHHAYKPSIEAFVKESTFKESRKEPRNILSVVHNKPVIGAKDFHNMIDASPPAFAVKRILAKEVALAIKKPLKKAPLLQKMQQQRKQLQKKVKLTKRREKKKVMFLANRTSVRLVGSRLSTLKTNIKEAVPTGILTIRSRLINKRGRVVKASYTILQQGKNIKKKKNTQSALFKLPIGEYTIQATYNGQVMQKKAIVTESHEGQFTFFYKKQDKDKFDNVMLSSKSAQKKEVNRGKIVVMSHDKEGRGKALGIDYFVYKNGQEVLHKNSASVTDFHLPIGDYILQAVRNDNEGKVTIREMLITVVSNLVVFPIFVFNENNHVLQKRKASLLKQDDKIMKGNDLKLIAELVLHNEKGYSNTHADSLELLPRLNLGYSRKNL